MNPILTITVEGTKASCAGTISVGEKIDVSVSGLGSIAIPFLDEDQTNPSLRLRIVDEGGHDVARFPLESTDVWTVTSGIYSASSVNLNTLAIRKMFEGVAYGDRLQFGVIIDSAIDYAQYARGKTYVQQWSMSSADDPKVLPDWSEVLSKLESDLATVASSKATAIESASAAVSAKNAASSYSSQASASALTANAASQSATAKANAASQSASTASAKADEASISASNAETYKNQASVYADSASAAADRAASVLSASVKKSGDTMTGTLSVPAVALNGSDLAGLISSAEASAESAAQAMVSEEAESRENADEVLSTTMAEERQDRINADLALSAGISTERARAIGVESTLSTGISNEVSRATAAETANANAILVEKERAMGVEAQLASIASGHMKMSVVDTLPSTGVEKTIYLVPAASSKTGNVKDEYLWVNSAWEKIGSTEVDLSEYAKTEDLADVAMSGSYNDLSDKPTIPDVSGKIDTSKIVAPDYSVVSNGFVADAKKTYDGKADAGSNNCYDFTRSGVAFHIEGTRIWVTIGSITEEIKETAITIGGKTFSYEYGECMWNDPDYEEVPGYVNLIWPSSKDSAGRNACKCKYRKQIEYIYPTKSSAIAENITNNFKSALFSEVAKKVSGDSTKTDMQAAVDARVDAKKPTKTSQLTNDSGFVTASDIPMPTRVKNAADTERIDGSGNIYPVVNQYDGGTWTAVGTLSGTGTINLTFTNCTKVGNNYQWTNPDDSSMKLWVEPNGVLYWYYVRGGYRGISTGATNPNPFNGYSFGTRTDSTVTLKHTNTNRTPTEQEANAKLAREYPIKSLTVTGSDATALDSTINTITPTATTTIAPPTAKTIGARDWIVVVTQGATAYGVTFSGSFVAESGFAWPTMEASKTYVFSFTEVSSNKFLAAVKEVANV